MTTKEKPEEVIRHEEDERGKKSGKAFARMFSYIVLPCAREI